MILLNRSYAGYAAGTIVELPASTETALVQSGGATVSVGPPTAAPAGGYVTTALQGAALIPAGAALTRVSNPAIVPQSIIYAVISQASADGTATRVDRVNVGAGFVDISVNANATAAVTVDWAIINALGSLSNPQ